MKILLKNRELSAFLAILALFAVLVALNPSYLSLQTLGMIFASSQILILLAIGAALVMLTRNIDVSVGSTVGLSAIAVGVALNSGYSLPVSILFALTIGALAGAFNGFLVVGLRIPAIVATLGTLGLYRGAMLLWTGGKWIEGLPPGLKSLSEPAAVGISPLGIVVLIIVVTGAWTLSRTAFGRDFYAVGDNLAAARQLGVAVNRTRMIAFTLNGMLAACAGIVFAAQIGFVPNQTGSGLEMKAIAACVLGGISLLGGTGTLIGAFLGAFFLTQIDTVLVLFRLPAWWNDFIAGLVLLGVLVLDGRLRQALSRHQRGLKYGRFQPGNKGGKHAAGFAGAGDPALWGHQPADARRQHAAVQHQRFHLHRHRGAAADAGDYQRRDRHFAGVDHWPVRHRAGGDDAGGVADGARRSTDAAARPAVRAGECGADPLHGYQPFSYHSRHALPLRRRGAAALRHGGRDGLRGDRQLSGQLHRVR